MLRLSSRTIVSSAPQPDDNTFISTQLKRPRKFLAGTIEVGRELDFALKSDRVGHHRHGIGRDVQNHDNTHVSGAPLIDQKIVRSSNRLVGTLGQRPALSAILEESLVKA